MENAAYNMSPEVLLENVTLEALTTLALGPADHVSDIAPFEAILPLITKAWDLPREVLEGKTERLERGKKLALESKGGLPGEPLLEYYDGLTTIGFLWALFKTAVRLEGRAERQAIYDVAVLLYEALSLPDFLHPSGKHRAKILGGMFRNAVRQDARLKRESICLKAASWVEVLCTHGIERTA